MLTKKDEYLLREFEKILPSEAACIDLVAEILKEEGMLGCNKCQSLQVERDSARTIKCIECNEITWFTSGTIFDHMKKLKPFFALLWFQGNQYSISSSRAHQLLHIAQSTAWTLIKKIKLIRSLDFEIPQAGTVSLGCELFTEALRKRSRETPARAHPRAELGAFNSESKDTDERESGEAHEPSQQSPDANECATPSSDAARSSRQRILDVLVRSKQAMRINNLQELTGIPMNDLLFQLTCMELESLIKSQSTDRYILNQAQWEFASASQSAPSVSFETIQKRVTEFLDFCFSIFHGTSRKYLQLYLFQFFHDTAKVKLEWREFIRSLIKRPPVHIGQILSFVSPVRVQFVAE